MPSALLPGPPAATDSTPQAVWPALRNGGQLSCFFLFFLLWLGFISWFGLLGELEVAIGADPITVELHGLNPADRNRVQLTYLTTVGDSDGDEKAFGFAIPHESVMFPDANRTDWKIAGHWIKTLHLTAPESVIRSLASMDVWIGGRKTSYSAEDLLKWPRQPKALTGLLPDRPRQAITIELPRDPNSTLPAINSIGLPAMVRRILTFPLVGLAVAILAAWLLVRIARSSVGVEFWNITIAVPSGQPVSSLWFWAGLALSAAGIASLYVRYSYPFTQDDNFSQFLPLVLFNCRSILEGHWPAWNPHQFMGAPVATIGIYSVTYPPLYLAYGLARVLGQEYWTIEIYTLLHLAAGYTLLYAVLRRMKIRASVAAIAGASYVLSGWFLIAGRSQMTFAPLAVWPVALAWSLHHLEVHRHVSWKWIAATALSIGTFFHAGHSQMWVYGMMLFASGIALNCLVGKLNWRQALQTIPALIIGIGLAAPLLILQVIEGTSSARAGSYGDRIDLLHMLLPLGSLWPRTLTLGSFGHEFFPEMYYSGTLFQCLSFATLLLALTRFVLCRTSVAELKQWASQNTWLILFGIALMFGLGSQGILWTLFSALPIFDRFRWPIKFTYFCLLYSTIGGAMLAERFFDRRPKLHFPALAAVACLLMVHVGLCRASWYDFADRPYPILPATIQTRILDPQTRVLTRWESMDRSPVAGFYRTLPLDFATQAGAYAVGGYDTFVEGSLASRRIRYRFWTDPIGAARAYGVKWVLSDRTLDNPVASTNLFFWSLEAAGVGNILAIHAAQDTGHLVASDKDLELYQLPNPDPLAFLDREHLPVPIRMNSMGSMIDSSIATSGDTLTCNVVMRPWLEATAQNGQHLKTDSDEWGRARIHIEHATPIVNLIYQPPWIATLLWGGLLVALGGLIFFLLRRLKLCDPEQQRPNPA